MHPHRISKENTFKGLPVNAGEGREVHGEAVESLHAVMEDYLSRHSRMFAMHLTFTYPREREYPKTNKLFADRFLRNFRTDRKRGDYDPAYAWCTEKDESNGPNLHHHLALMLDGNETRSPHSHFETAKRQWGDVLGIESGDGYVNYAVAEDRKNGHMVHRNDEEAKAEAFEHFTYLTKTREKDELPPGLRRWGTTRPKKKG